MERVPPPPPFPLSPAHFSVAHRVTESEVSLSLFSLTFPCHRPKRAAVWANAPTQKSFLFSCPNRQCLAIQRATHPPRSSLPPFSQTFVFFCPAEVYHDGGFSPPTSALPNWCSCFGRNRLKSGSHHLLNRNNRASPPFVKLGCCRNCPKPPGVEWFLVFQRRDIFFEIWTVLVPDGGNVWVFLIFAWVPGLWATFFLTTCARCPPGNLD